METKEKLLSGIKAHAADLLVVMLFAVVSFAYFFPADTEGRILYRHDSAAGRGAGQEISDFRKQTGEQSRWTNALFGGMPTYQSAPSYSSTDILKQASDAYHLWLPENVWFLFAYLLGFYILLRAFDFRWHLAALGSVMWAFSSYFLIIIAAGHLWKVMALAYLPPMIGGIVLAYRGRYAAGFVVTALFAAMEILANHVQMTYYYMIIIICMVAAYLVESIREKRMPHFFKATAVCAAAAALAVMLNLSNLYHTWEYQKESMRGKSELVKADSANQTSSGLERDYITQWSYGIDETLTLLVPNAKGGSSMTPMAESATAMAHADNNFLSVYQQIGQYWGEQPMTSGPVYVGAFVVMLFFLGLFILKGPMKWALYAATVLSVLLSWGKNFMPFTDFFIDYVPMYAKFRTVASILVVAEFTMPLIAMLTLKNIIDNPAVFDEEEDRTSRLLKCFLVSPLALLAKKKRTYIYISLFITAGMCALFALAPSTFFTSFISTAEQRMLANAIPPEYLPSLLENLQAMRMAMFSADCWRSCAVILAGTLLLFLFLKKKLSAAAMALMMAVLCLFDLWQIDKRYLNDAMFVNADVRDLPQPMTQTDQRILQDKTLGYRVLNLASNTFNENETSYYHKSIGGYHAAKLRRYQELIERYIQPEMQATLSAVVDAAGDMSLVSDTVSPVLNMLNAKYLIMPLEGGQTAPLANPNANGVAWFVDDLRYVANANEELDAMAGINLKTSAVADRKFADVLGKAARQDSASYVKMTAYNPNHLEYEAYSKTGGVIVFSEIYYPGWTATVDGKQTELGRANYVLRALNTTPGKHTVVLDFHPATLKVTEATAYTAYIILLLAIALIVVQKLRKKKG